MARKKPTVDELQDELDEKDEYIQDVESQLDDIADIAGGEDEGVDDEGED